MKFVSRFLRRIGRWRTMAFAGLLFLALTGLLPLARASVFVVPTADAGKEMRIITTGAPGGLAVDSQGNVYYSDQGRGAATDGSIYLLRRNNPVPIKILTGLDRPGDVELSHDKRALIIALPGGRILRQFFGVTLQIKDNAGKIVTDATVTALTDTGPTQGYRPDAQGFYRIPNLLVPEQTSNTMIVIIERGSDAPLRVELPLGLYQTDGQASGETVKILQLSP